MRYSRHPSRYRTASNWGDWIFVIAIVVGFIGLFAWALSSCNDDREVIRGAEEDVWQYTSYHYYSAKGEDTLALRFKNMRTGETYEYKGLPETLRVLERVNKGDCYLFPIDPDKTDQVPCG